MIKRLFGAGMVLIPARFFLWPLSMPAAQDAPSTPTLEKLSAAPWLEGQRYDRLPLPERYAAIRNDAAFFRRMADRATSAGITLTGNQMQILEEERIRIEYQHVFRAIWNATPVTPEELAAPRPEWTAPLPEQWEAFYIYIDTTMAQTPEEAEAFRQRAQWVRDRLTPENFRTMAMLWSDAPDSAEGGSLGVVTLGGFGPTFSSHIRQTPPGTIGGPYPTQSGWNIFYVRTHLPSRERTYTTEQLTRMIKDVKVSAELAGYDPATPEWTALLDKWGVRQSPDFRFEQQMSRNYALFRRYLDEMIGQNDPPSDAELRELFEANREGFVHPPRRRARAIFLTDRNWSATASRDAWLIRRQVRNQGRELRERALAGEDFAELARRYSQGPNAAAGGDMGWVQEPSSPQLDRALAALEPGEITPPLAQRNGYMIIQLVQVERNRPMTLEEARPLLEARWKAALAQRLASQWRAEFP